MLDRPTLGAADFFLFGCKAAALEIQWPKLACQMAVFAAGAEAGLSKNNGLRVLDGQN